MTRWPSGGYPRNYTVRVKRRYKIKLLQYIYENSVKKQVAGMSSAMAVILGLCIMAVTFVQMRMMVKNAQE